MYHIKLDAYVPAPQPATADRIVAAHYYAAWKLGAAQIHDGFHELEKEFPQNTPLMGYYDEENPEVCDWEIKWATEHGVNCFIYCWYRKKENAGKPITVADLRCGHGLHEALFNAKYQQMMKFAIMYEASPRWCGTDEQDMLENLLPFWMETYFQRGNYLVIDNCPVLFVYQQQRLNACFQSAQSQKQTFDACRDYCRAKGFSGMIFAVCNTSLDKETYEDLLKRGYDFRFGYDSGYHPAESWSAEQEIIEGQCALFRQRLEMDPMRHIPTVSCFRDSTPRATQKWIDMGYHFHEEKRWKLSPDNYRLILRRMKEMSDALPDGAWAKKIIMLDNWNEWDEGHFIAPSHAFGFRYLQAVREELTAHDNLPDYRMPQDMGFTGYNKSWGEPDFAQLCEKRLQAEQK